MSRRQNARASGFTLIEAAVSMVVVATMFVAGLAAAGSAARDRQTQTDMRLGQQLVRTLMAEVCQQRYADPAPNTIGPAAGVSTTDRSNWTHIDDYADFVEKPPKDRTGRPIPGATGWKWQVGVAYTTFSGFGGRSTGAPSGGLVGGLLGGVTSVVTSVVDPPSATDTGLKKITVTAASPGGKAFTLTCLRSSAGAVDRMATGTGFHTWAGVTMTVGADGRTVQCGAPLLNTPGR